MGNPNTTTNRSHAGARVDVAGGGGDDAAAGGGAGGGDSGGARLTKYERTSMEERHSK